MAILSFLLVLLFPLLLIFGFSSMNYKLKKQMENQEKIIERLDLLVKKVDR